MTFSRIRRTSAQLLFILTGTAALLVPARAAVDTSTWTNAVTGAWNVDGNWTNVPVGGGFPNNGNGGVATYDAIISATGAAYSVNLGTNVTVEDLTLSSADATLNQTGGTFTATDAIAISAGTYQLNSGTISNTTMNLSGTGSLVFTANGGNLLTGVTVHGDLMLNNTNSRTLIAAGTTFTIAHLAANASALGYAPGQTLNSTILFEGGTGTRTVEMNGTAGAFTIGSTGVIRTQTGLTGNGQIGGSVQYGGAMALTNQGLISSQISGRTISLEAASFTNSATGIAEATNGGLLTIDSATWTNVGLIRALTGATANLNGGWSNLGGTVTADATSILNFGGTFSTANLGTLNLAAASAVNVTGAWANTGQTFTLNSGAGVWTLAGGSITGGTLTMAAGQTLLVTNLNSNLLSGVTVNGDLTLNVTSARTQIAGGTTFTTAHLAANAAELGFAPGSTLSGTVIIEGVIGGGRYLSMNNTAGALTISASGVVRTATGLTGDGQIGVGNNFGGAMTLTNQGLISSQASNRNLTINPASLTNTGTLSASSGGILTIAPTNPWANAGTISVNAATINLNGTFNATGGIGTWSNTAGTVNINGTLNNTGNTLTLDSTTGSWTLNGGTFSGGTLAFANGQTLLLGSSNSNLITGVTVNGDLTFNTTSARTQIAGGTTFTTAHLAANATEIAFAPGATLDGAILVEAAIGGGRFVSMTAAGALTIGPSGIFETVTGLTGDGQIGVGNNFGGAMTLINQGLISSQVSNRTITINPASLTNTGTLSASNGGILTIGPAAAWTNAGTISIDHSTLNLNGTFNTTAGIGTWSNNAGTVNVNGTINNTGSTLTLNTATGSWTLTGGTLSGGTLAFANGQTLLLSSNSSNTVTGVTVNGDLTFNANSARAQIAGGTTFTTAHLAASATELAFTPGSTLSGTILAEAAIGGGRFVSMTAAGALTISPSGIFETVTGLTGDGQIGVGNNFGGAMTLINQGLISSQVSNRTITINPASLTNTGTLSASSGGILTIAPAAAWTNAGTISIDHSTLNLNGTFNTTAGIGTWSNNAGTVNVNGTINNTGSTLTLNTATGSWTLTGGTLSGGTLAFANGQTLLFGSNSSNTITGVTVNGDLTFNANSARAQIAGGTTFTTAHLAASATELGFTPGSTLSGTILAEAAIGGGRFVSMTAAGALTIGPSGIFETVTGLTGDGQIGVGNNFGGAMTLINQGLISSQVSNRTITINPASLTNTGTLSASNGGILTIGPAAAWTNAGTISIDHSTLNLNGTFNTTAGIGTWSNNAGTVNVNGTINNTGSTLTLNTATGSWTLTGGTLSGGTLAFANGQTLLLSSNSSNTVTGVTVNGDLTFNVNSARAQIAGGTTFTTAHLAASATELAFAAASTLSGTVLFEAAIGGTRFVSLASAGALTIGSGGVVRTETGLTGDGQIGVGNNFGGAMALTNQGLISSQVSNRTLTINPASLTNTGTLSASNGGILTIAPTNPWANAGLVSLNNATLNLNGTFNTAGGIGTWSNTASTVNINGTINNAASTLTLDNTTGSWTLNGGTISGGTVALNNGQTLLLTSNSSNLITGVTVNGDLTFNTSSARAQIAGGTTFTTAHLAANATEIAFAPGSTLTGTVLYEGAAGGTRYVSLVSPGALTIAPAGVIRTAAALTGNGQIGLGNGFSGAMTLTNQGLISSQVSGRVINIDTASFTNAGTLEATNGGTLTIPRGYTQTAGTTRVVGGTITAQTTGVNDTLTLTAGTLEGHGTVNAKVTAGGVINPTIGTGGLVINGDLTLSGHPELRFALAGPTQATQYDFLSEAGTAALTLAGTLKLEFAGGFETSISGAQTFTILTSNQPLLGTFDNVASGLRLATADGIGSFVVSYGAGSPFGDANVVLSDFVAIPEPSTFALLAFALGALTRRQRRLPAGQ